MAYRAMREAVLSVEAGAQQHRVRGVAEFYELELMPDLSRSVDDRNILAVAVFLAVQRESAERHALGLPAGAGSEDVAFSAVADDRRLVGSDDFLGDDGTFFIEESVASLIEQDGHLRYGAGCLHAHALWRCACQHAIGVGAIENIYHIENFFELKAEDGLLLKGGARRPGWQVAWDNEGNEGMPDLDLRGQGSEQGAYASQEAGKHALCVLGRLLRRG